MSTNNDVTNCHNCHCDNTMKINSIGNLTLAEGWHFATLVETILQ